MNVLPPNVTFAIKSDILVSWWDRQIHTLMMAKTKFGSNWTGFIRDQENFGTSGEDLQIMSY